jgi:hypothetical protein
VYTDFALLSSPTAIHVFVSGHATLFRTLNPELSELNTSEDVHDHELEE